jgi:hypothetical protein
MLAEANRREPNLGDGLLTDPPDHPQYQAVLAHLEGLVPGESKPVPPWPE